MGRNKEQSEPDFIDPTVILDPVATEETATEADPALGVAPMAASAPTTATGTVFVHDASELGSICCAGISRTRYEGATMEPVTSWSNLAGRLSHHGTIDRLVICAHGDLDGRFVINGVRRTYNDMRAIFRDSGVCIRSEVVFECCRMLANPVAAAYILQDVVAPCDATTPGLVITGYNLYLICEQHDYTLTPGSTVDDITRMIFDEREMYIPRGGGQTPEQIASAPPGPFTVYYEYFSDRDVAGTMARRSGPEYVRTSRSVASSDLRDRIVASAAEGRRVGPGGPSPDSWLRVQVTDVAAVAAGMTPEEAAL